MTNASCWRQAQRYLAGGVNSPVRSFKAVGAEPFFVNRGAGPYLWDVEGRKLLDYVGSWGAIILGHRHPAVLRAVQEGLRRGITFGTPTPSETALAREITRAMPAIEQIRFVSSGTEAVMSAIRLARAATGRRKILKFDGGYHGHADCLLARAGSGMATLGIPASPGVPRPVTEDTITVSFNDLPGVEQAIRRHGKQLACLIVEPVMANAGVIPPEPGFLKGLRALTAQRGILLIFDEVITGFRVGYSGAQGLFGVRPDLTTLGKVIGGGFAIGAYGGPARLMKLVAPRGKVYQAGTLSGHPIAMAAGLATLRVLRRPKSYQRLNESGSELAEGLRAISARAGIPVTVNQVGSLATLFFKLGSVRSAAGAKKADARRYARYFRGMLSRGIYGPPSPFEAWFLSAAHGKREIEKTLKAHQEVVSKL